MNDAFTYVFLLHTVWDNAFDESVRDVCDRTSPDGVPLQCAVNGVSWIGSVALTDWVRVGTRTRSIFTTGCRRIQKLRPP